VTVPNATPVALATAAAPRWRHGELLWTLVRTDFKSRYHGSAGGFLWALLKPLAMFVVLLAVFSFVFATDADYRLNLIIGLFLWDFFAESTRFGLTALHAKGFLLGKARFPSWLVVVASAANPLITLLVFTVVIAAFLAAAGRPPGLVGLALFAVYAAHLLLMVIGFSLATSVLFLRYRDLNQVWDVALQAGFFVAPVVYPLSILPERVHFFLFLWPPTPVIQFARDVLVAGTIPSLRAHLYLTAMTAATLAIGVTLFARHRRRAAEYL
jgi:lipopolysaccharide transport system permease protein